MCCLKAKDHSKHSTAQLGHSSYVCAVTMNRVTNHCRETYAAIPNLGSDISPVDTLRRRKTPTTAQVNRPSFKLSSFYLSLSSKKRVRSIFLVFIFILVVCTLLVIKTGNLKLDFNRKDYSVTTSEEPWSFESAKNWFIETASLQDREQNSIDLQNSLKTKPWRYEFASDTEENKELEIPFLQIWRHLDLDITVCRLFGVCVGYKGLRIFLNSSDIRKQLEYCGIKPQHYDSAGPEEWMKTLSSSDYLLYLDKDLVSYTPLRTHMPHFIEDITPFLAFRDVLVGQRTNIHNLPFRQRCLWEDKFPGVACHTRNDDLHPFFLFDSAGFHRFNGSWTHHFLTGLAGNVDLNSAVGCIDSNSTMRCFRSVVVGKGLDMKYLLNHENSFFKGKFMRKQPLPPSHWCEKPIQATILSRRPNNARTLLDAETFAENIRRLQVTKDSKREQKTCHVRFTCQIVYFEEMTFLEQIAVMQKTDILIAVHGAGNTNIIFLPENSIVIEIYPFAYKANIFEELAKKYLLKYDFLIAEPDTESFKQCLQKILRSHPELENKVKKLTNQWDLAVAKFLKGDHSHQFKMESPKVSDLVPSSRVCARNQTLRITWRELCDTIRRQVAQML